PINYTIHPKRATTPRPVQQRKIDITCVPIIDQRAHRDRPFQARLRNASARTTASGTLGCRPTAATYHSSEIDPCVPWRPHGRHHARPGADASATRQAYRAATDPASPLDAIGVGAAAACPAGARAYPAGRLRA